MVRLDDLPDASPPPIVLAALGPRTLELAGRCFDGVVLHGVLTPEAVSRSREVVRSAALEVGRDPDAVRVYATVITAPDCSEAELNDVIGARAVTTERLFEHLLRIARKVEEQPERAARFEGVDDDEARVLHRYVNTIQVQRQDFNGRMLTIRRDDLRAIAAAAGIDVDALVRRLDDLQLRRA